MNPHEIKPGRYTVEVADVRHKASGYSYITLKTPDGQEPDGLVMVSARFIRRPRRSAQRGGAESRRGGRAIS